MKSEDILTALIDETPVYVKGKTTPYIIQVILKGGSVLLKNKDGNRLKVRIEDIVGILKYNFFQYRSFYAEPRRKEDANNNHFIPCKHEESELYGVYGKSRKTGYSTWILDVETSDKDYNRHTANMIAFLLNQHYAS